MKRTKHASLSLSINAIVVLILAVAMLGLGLGFTKSMFAKFGDKLEVPIPNYPATPEDPIVLPADSVTVSSTKESVLTVNIYAHQGIAATVPPTMSCVCTGSVSTTDPIFTGQDVGAGEYKGFKAIIPPLSGASGESCLCTITATDGTSTTAQTKSKQITLNIQ